MEEICKYLNCTGCGICSLICPSHCITMVPDEYGFYHPEIKKSQCVGCNLCKKKCPQNNKDNKMLPRKVLAAWNKNPNERKSSSSGGIAAGFYQYALEQGYYICGTRFCEGMTLQHIITKNPKERESFKGSKYVQSLAYPIFAEIQSVLKDEKKVLFVGTPCQVAGLFAYLGRGYPNLITVDLVCHGVPSQRFLSEHIDSITKIDSADISITFRDENGWYLDIKKNGTSVYRSPAHEDFYYEGFLDSLFYRESCYHCKYACTERIADITIGDFWGLGKLESVSYPTEKVSLVLVNSHKGEKFWKEATRFFIFEERSIEEAIIDNDQLVHPSYYNQFTTRFKTLYRDYGFENAAKKCLRKAILKHKKEVFFRKLKYKMCRKG